MNIDFLRRRRRKLEYDKNAEKNYLKNSPWLSSESVKDLALIEQELEDIRIELLIKRAANKMFYEWLEIPTYIINNKPFKRPLLTYCPVVEIYYIYNEQTAKYAGRNINDCVNEEFEKLKTSN